MPSFTLFAKSFDEKAEKTFGVFLLVCRICVAQYKIVDLPLFSGEGSWIA